MKNLIRWPTVCMRCGSLEHMTEDCPIPTLGMSQQERDHAIETRRGKQQILALIVFLAVAHVVISLWLGVEA